MPRILKVKAAGFRYISDERFLAESLALDLQHLRVAEEELLRSGLDDPARHVLLQGIPKPLRDPAERAGSLGGAGRVVGGGGGGAWVVSGDGVGGGGVGTSLRPAAAAGGAEGGSMRGGGQRGHQGALARVRVAGAATAAAAAGGAPPARQ